jgi:hypothetical protein
VGFRWSMVLETLLVGCAFGICNGIGRRDLVWPAVGAAVSLHFAPMAYLFRLPLYYVTAALGCVVSAIALTQAAPANLWVAGAGMGGFFGRRRHLPSSNRNCSPVTLPEASNESRSRGAAEFGAHTPIA